MSVVHWLVGLAAMSLGVQCPARDEAHPFSVFSGTMVEMSWPEVKAAGEKKSVVLLPVSVVEEHGPHMDLGPDIYVSTAHARAIRDVLVERGVPTLVAPPYYWGINEATGAYPGSFTLPPELFRRMLREIAANLRRWGFEEIYFVNGHGDSTHIRHLHLAAEEIRDELEISCEALDNLPPLEDHVFAVPRKRLPWRDIHAGANETRLVHDLAPQRVNLTRIEELPRQSSFRDPLGYVGDPAKYAEGNGLEVLIEGARYNAARIVAHRAARKSKTADKAQ